MTTGHQDPTPDARAWSLLRQFHPDEKPHSEGSLLDHLKGTHDLLKAWGNPRQVCVGGLFHSVYGTQSYTHQLIPLDRRETIREAIGEDAERLAYLFCVSERGRFFEEIGKESPRIFNRLEGRAATVAPGVLRDLIEIEVANYVEFLPRVEMTGPELESLLARVAAAMAMLTPGAYRAASDSARRKRPSDRPEVR